MKLKWEDDGTFKTPMARVRGLGSAHGGTEHWWHERLTSVAAVPLTLWLAWAVLSMPGWDYDTFTAWLAAPVNAILLILTVLVMFYHAALGSRVIVEDYIHAEWIKTLKLIGINLYFFAAGVVCIFAILKIAFGGYE